MNPLNAVIPELATSKKLLQFFGNVASSGIQQKNDLISPGWIPDEALHQILKKNLGKASSGMTGYWSYGL